MKQFLPLLIIFLSGYAASAQNGVYITAGAQWVCVGNPIITLSNVSEFVNKGTFVAGNSTVEIQEGAVATAIGTSIGASPIEFYKLTINNSKGAKLVQAISVVNNLNLVKGKLFLKNRVIKLGTSALLTGENESRRLLDDNTKAGQISITQTLAASPNVNPGNLGVKIVSSASPLGTTTIKRYCGVIAVNGSTGGIIQRYYKITKQFNAGLNAKLNFSYLNAELNGIFPSKAVLWNSADNGITWASVVPDIRDTIAKFLQKGGLNSFPALWTIGSTTGAKMPMIVEAFNVKGNEKGNALTWSFEETQPYDYFILEKSKDQTIWSDLGTIWANDGDNAFNFNDPYTGEAYYRLRQYDNEGKMAYSKIIRSDELVSNVSVLLYPNPAKNYFNITFHSPSDGRGNIDLFSASGEKVKTIPVMLNKGVNNLVINVRGLTAGSYMLSLHQKGIDFSKRVVIQ